MEQTLVAPSGMFIKQALNPKRPVILPAMNSPYSLVSLITCYLSAGKHMLFVPFSLQFLPSSSTFACFEKKDGLYKFLYGVVIAICIIPSATQGAWGLWESGNSWDSLFVYSVMLIWVVTLCNFFRITWQNGPRFSEVVSSVNRVCAGLELGEAELPSSQLGHGLAYLSVGLCLIWSTLDAAFKRFHLQVLVKECLLNHHSEPDSSALSSWGSGGNGTMTWGIAMKIIGLPPGLPHNIPGFILAAFLVVSAALSTFATHFADVLNLVHAACFYILTRAFTRRLRQGYCEKDWVLDMVGELSRLSELMEAAIGSNVWCTCFILLPLYAFKVRSIFAADYVVAAHCIIYIVILAAFFYLAAESNSMLSEVVSWLQATQNKRKYQSLEEQLVFHDKLAIVLHQIQGNDIGIKGKCFTLTYGYVGNMLSLMLTYSIIMFQMQESQ